MLKKYTLSIALSILIISCLSGCNENSNNINKEKFIGVWHTYYYDSANDISYDITYSYYANNTAKAIYIIYIDNESEDLTFWVEYTITKSELCHTYVDDPSVSTCYDYIFSNNDTKLTITTTNEPIEKFEYTKISN